MSQIANLNNECNSCTKADELLILAGNENILDAKLHKLFQLTAGKKGGGLFTIFLAMLVAGGCKAGAIIDKTQDQMANVQITSPVQVRKAPGDGEPAAFYLPAGHVVKVIGRKNGWLEIVATAGSRKVTGFVPTNKTSWNGQ